MEVHIILKKWNKSLLSQEHGLGKEFPITEFLDFDDYFSTKEEKMNNKLNEITVKSFENKNKDLMEIFGFTERELRDHYDKCINLVKDKGFKLYDVKLRNKHRQLKQKSIWAIDNESIRLWANENEYKIDLR